MRHLDGGEAFELTRIFAVIIDSHAAMPVGRVLVPDLQRRTVRALTVAWRALTGGPEALTGLLLDARRANGRNRGGLGVGAILASDGNENQLPAVSAALMQIQSALSNVDGTIPDENMKVKEAAWALGVTETEIAAARDDGDLVTRAGVRNGRLLRNLDRPEIEMLAAARKSRLSRTRLCTLLGLPAYAVEDVLCRGTIALVDHAWIRRRYGEPQATREALENLLTELREAIGDPSGPLVDLGRAMRCCGGRPKPWGAALDQLRAGRMPSRIGQEGADAGSILVAESDLARLCRLEGPAWASSYSQVDALDILNLPPKHAEHLRSMSVLAAAQNRWTVCGARLKLCAESHVSPAELAARTGLRAQQIMKVVAEMGLKRMSIFGWDRRETEDRMADLL